MTEAATATTTLNRFIGYHLKTYSPDDPARDTVPISTGRTEEEAQASASIRVLLMGFTDGYIGVQDRTEDVTEAEWQELKTVLDKKFTINVNVDVETGNGTVALSDQGAGRATP